MLLVKRIGSRVGISWVNGIDTLIVRPLKDIQLKELGFFNYYEKVPFIIPFPMWRADQSIDLATQNFLAGLQVEYPSTMNTVTRTIFKVINKTDKNGTRCQFCLGPVKEGAQEWAAMHTVSTLNEQGKVKQLPSGTCYSCFSFAQNIQNINSL